MNWEAIGAIAEMLGSLAVLFTLAYLAIQVRHSRALLEENRKISLSQVHSDRTQSWMNIHYMYLQSDRMVETAAKLQEAYEADRLDETLDGLSTVERFTTHSHRMLVLLHQDNNLYQADLGLLSDDALASTRTTISRQMPIWRKLDLPIPPRVQEEYEKTVSDDA